MKLIYVAGPYRGKNSWAVEQNIRYAEEVGFELAELGAVPVIPHSMYRYFDRTLTDEFWLAGAIELMRRCDAVVLVDNWRTSSGSIMERDRAEELGLPVFEWEAADGEPLAKFILGVA